MNQYDDVPWLRATEGDHPGQSEPIAPDSRDKTNSSANDPDTSLLFSFADNIIGLATQTVAEEGQRGAFSQILVPNPEALEWHHEVHREMYDRRAARSFLYGRARQGYHGLLAFSCLDYEAPRVYLEAFDTRTGHSIALSRALRKTMLGRYVIVKVQGELHGNVVPLHIDS